MHGYEAVVGPVKGVLAKENAVKPREHTLLVKDRPSYVTILTLGMCRFVSVSVNHHFHKARCCRAYNELHQTAAVSYFVLWPCYFCLLKNNLILVAIDFYLSFLHKIRVCDELCCGTHVNVRLFI